MTDMNHSEQARVPYREEAVRGAAERHAPAEGLPDTIPVWLRAAFWLLALPILLGIAAVAAYGWRLPPLSGDGP